MVMKFKGLTLDPFQENSIKAIEKNNLNPKNINCTTGRIVLLFVWCRWNYYCFGYIVFGIFDNYYSFIQEITNKF